MFAILQTEDYGSKSLLYNDIQFEQIAKRNDFSIDTSSRPKMLYKKAVLKNFVKFTEKHLCQSLF